MENYVLTSKKSNFDKLFKKSKLFIIILLILTIGISIFEYTHYLSGQFYAVELMKATSDEYDSYTGNYSELVNKIYHDLNPSYRGSMTVDLGEEGVVTIGDNSDVISAASDADFALGELLSKKGFSCYNGSKYLKFTGFFGYFKFYFEQLFEMYDDGILLTCSIISFSLTLIYSILIILYKSIINRNIIITDEQIICQHKEKTVKQFMIKDITSVQLIPIKGLKLTGNGIQHSIFLIENSDEIKDFIIKKLKGGIENE